MKINTPDAGLCCRVTCRILAISGALVAFVATLPAKSADLAAPTVSAEPTTFDDRWSFAAGLYGWGVALDGTVGVGRLPPAQVNASFRDILDDLNSAFMGIAEARYDKFGLLTDVVYSRIEAGSSGPRGYVRADLTTSMLMGTAMGTYRAVEEGHSSLDVMAGVRLWHVSNSLDLTGPNGGAVGATQAETWVDPMVGMRARLQGDTPFFVTAWGMIGGFGVSANLQGDILAAVGYEITDRFSFIAGYRAAGVDYSDSDFTFNTLLHGPVVSAVINF